MSEESEVTNVRDLEISARSSVPLSFPLLVHVLIIPSSTNLSRCLPRGNFPSSCFILTYQRGCGVDLLINILLTILGYIPGIVLSLSMDSTNNRFTLSTLSCFPLEYDRLADLN